MVRYGLLSGHASTTHTTHSFFCFMYGYHATHILPFALSLTHTHSLTYKQTLLLFSFHSFLQSSQQSFSLRDRQVYQPLSRSSTTTIIQHIIYPLHATTPLIQVTTALPIRILYLHLKVPHALARIWISRSYELTVDCGHIATKDEGSRGQICAVEAVVSV
jgi:hypothetical protein